MLDAMAELAKKERESSEPYKNMFKSVGGKPFPVQLRRVDDDMTGVVLNYTQILENEGYKVTNEVYYFLLALPFLANKLEKEITNKEGYVCCVDKTFELLHREFFRILEKK